MSGVRVPIRVVLPPGDADAVATAPAQVRAVVADLAGQLALPVEAAATAGRGDRRHLVVDGVTCGLPGRHPPGPPAAWIARTLHGHAPLLVTPEVAGAVWAGIAGPTDGAAGAEPAWFRSLVRELVRCRVRPDRLGPLLDAPPREWLEPARLFESALSATELRVRIVVDEQTSSTWTDSPAELRRLMAFLATGLFDELGLPLAVPSLDVDPALPAHHFTVQVGDVRTVPAPGIRPDEILVNDTAERLSQQWPDLPVVPAVNPATGLPAAVTPASFTDRLQSADLTVWTMSGYVVLAAAEVIRLHADALYRAGLLRHQLDRLAADHPLLSPMVQELGGVPLLTRVLRRLLRDEVPIHGLPDIVASLYGAVPAPRREPDRVLIPTRRLRADVVAAPEVGDLREASLVETARGVLSAGVTHKFARGTVTLVAYILDAAVENRLHDPAELTAPERLALLDMVAAELALLPATAQQPVILTRAAVRARLRSVLVTEHPRLAVLAYEELAGDLNVQPVARLSLPG